MANPKIGLDREITKFDDFPKSIFWKDNFLDKATKIREE